MKGTEALFLGIVQGLTEFLPISSSGHLVVFQHLLGFKEPELLLDTVLHMGTLVAVCLYLRSDLQEIVLDILRLLRGGLSPRHGGRWKGAGPHAALAFWVVVATVPTACIGLLFRSPLERLFGSVSFVGWTLIITGLILAITKFAPRATNPRESLGLLSALAIGTAQGLAIMPGISRSGITIACGLLLGLDRGLAARFSFLLSIPAVTGAAVLQMESQALERVGLSPMVWGFLASAASGLFALMALMAVVRKGRLHYFSPYCWAVGILILIASLD